MVLHVTEAQALTCCASLQWARKLANMSPFADFDALLESARSIWWSGTGVSGWLEAFAAHPKIGDNKAAEAKPAQFGALSRSEQAMAAETSTAEVARELGELNQRYHDKFGFIYIICAKGRTAQELLSVLRTRITRMPYEELQQVYSGPHAPCNTCTPGLPP